MTKSLLMYHLSDFIDLRKLSYALRALLSRSLLANNLIQRRGSVRMREKERSYFFIFNNAWVCPDAELGCQKVGYEFEDIYHECPDLNFAYVNRKYTRKTEDKVTRLNFAMLCLKIHPQIARLLTSVTTSRQCVKPSLPLCCRLFLLLICSRN